MSENTAKPAGTKNTAKPAEHKNPAKPAEHKNTAKPADNSAKAKPAPVEPDWAELWARSTGAVHLALPDPLPDDIAELFVKCQTKLGMVPNVLVSYAHRPEKLRAFSLIYNDLMLGPSGLSKLEREMIAVLVSAHNRCWYCQVAHGAQVRLISGDPVLGEALHMNWRMADLDARQRAILSFAEKVTVASATIEEADRDALRAHGLSEEDIWDVAAVTGFFAMSNRVSSALGKTPNADYHGMAR